MVTLATNMHKPYLTAMLVLSLLGFLAATKPAAAWTFKVIHSFCANGDCTEGRLPGGLIEDTSGNLFGTAVDGGYHDGGTVFELIPNADRSNWRLKVLYRFCAVLGCPDGHGAYGNLILDKAGNLYGVTIDGGPGKSGVIYELSPKGRYQALYALCPTGGPCDDGNLPGGLTYAGDSQGIVYDGASPLYGLTVGGANARGNAFVLERKKHAWMYSVIHAFCSRRKCSDGAYPSALTTNASGALNGVSNGGGKHGHGLIFGLSLAGKHRWTESILYDFCQTRGCLDGASPITLSIASEGSLFGAASGFGPNCGHLHNQHGCGVLFQINPDGTGYNVLYGFCAEQKCVDGRLPLDMQEVQAGGFLGLTYQGGATDYGTVFQFKDGSFQSIYQFCNVEGCSDGKLPESRLVVDASGSIFGTTSYGGA